jgi:hypothetical protein
MEAARFSETSVKLTTFQYVINGISSMENEE